MKYKILHIIPIVIGLSLFSNAILVSADAEKIEYSNLQGYSNFEPKIIDSLKKQNVAQIMVVLNDESGIFIPYSEPLELKKDIWIKKYDWSRNKIKDILSHINQSDFYLQNEYLSFGGFAGRITKNGFIELVKNQDVKMIYLDRVSYTLLDESVPLINATKINHEIVDDMNITGKYETVCVIDSGVDKYHSDLNGKVVAEKCFCKSTVERSSCCPNGEDIDENATDETGHGTLVSGIIAANGNLNGVAPGANIAAVKVCDYMGRCYNSDIADAIEWCYNVTNRELYNISVISISLGDGIFYTEENCSNDAKEAIDIAVDEGLPVVVSSGNGGYVGGVYWPACQPNATSVGVTYDHSSFFFNCSNNDGANCTDSDYAVDQIACGSNRAEILDFLAPGAEINSTVPNASCTPYCDISGYANEWGTSLSAPHVSGAFTLLIQYEKLKNNRTLTPAEIEERFKETGILITDNYNSRNDGDGSGLTFPRIDAYAALFPIDVSDFEIVEDDTFHKTFLFNVKNNYNNQTKTVSWSFDIGNGTEVNSNESITLSPKEDALVFFEYNYTDGDIYNINATATSGELSDSETMQLTIGDLIAYDLSVLYTGFMHRTFGFRVLNNMLNPIIVNWSLDTDDTSGGLISAINDTELGINEEVFVYVDYDYFASGSKDVVSTATNDSYTDSDEIDIGVS